MNGCDNITEQTVQKGYDYVVRPIECGCTGVHGEPVYCDSCLKKAESVGHEKHQCRHGKDLYPEHGGDINCIACELGD